jgi:hypothetical protein
MDVASSAISGPPRVARPPRGRTRQLAAGAALLACMTVFASRVAWYDLRIVVTSLQFAMQPLFAVYVVCLAPFVVYAYLSGGTWLAKSGLLLLFHLVLLYGWAIFVIVGEGEADYALQDTVKLTFIPAAFFLVIASTPRRAGWVLGSLAVVIMGYQVLRILAFSYLAPGFFYFGGVTDAYPVCYWLAKVSKDRSERISQNALMLLLALGLAVIGQKRTLLAAFACVLAYTLLRSLGGLVTRPTLQVAALGGAVVAVALVCSMGDLGDTQFFDRVRKTDVREMLTEETSRQMEVRDVYNHLVDRGWKACLTGLGHGATFEREEASKATGATVIHSVHFTPAALHLRYGLVGWVLYAAVACSVLLAREPAGNGFTTSADYLAMKNYGVAAFVSSFAMYGLVDDMLVGMSLGIFAVAKAKQRAAEAHRLCERRTASTIAIRQRAA